MRKYQILLLILLFADNLFGQIAGLSASKLGTLSADVVPAGTIEFEPFFAYSLSTKVFDQNGSRQNLFSSPDSTMRFSASGFRFSYGVMKNLEWGVSVPLDVSEIRFGTKYKIPLEGKLKLAIIAGYSTILGNQIYVRRSAVHETTPSLNAGFVLSYYFSDKFSIDFDTQFQKHTQISSTGHTEGYYLNTDIGYYLLDKVNFIIGINYNYQFYEIHSRNSNILTLNTGIAIEKASNFILVLNAPFDILGRNEYQTKGFGMALTIILD